MPPPLPPLYGVVALWLFVQSNNPGAPVQPKGFKIRKKWFRRHKSFPDIFLRYFPEKIREFISRYSVFKLILTLTRIPSQMPLELENWPTNTFEGLKDVYGHDKNLLCWNHHPAAIFIIKSRIPWIDLTDSHIFIKLPSLANVYLLGIDLYPKYPIWVVLSPEMGPHDAN